MAAALPRLALGHHCLAPEPSEQLRDLMPPPSLPCLPPQFRIDPGNPIVRPSLQGVGIGGAWCYRESTDGLHARPFFVGSGSFAIDCEEMTGCKRRAQPGTATIRNDACTKKPAGAAGLTCGTSVTIDLLGDDEVYTATSPITSITVSTAPFGIPGTAYRVLLLVDNIELRRHAGRVGATVAESILSSLRDLNVPFVVVDLPIGDFVWVAAPISSDKDYADFKVTTVCDPWWYGVRMLGYVVERKRTNDLYHSMTKTDDNTKLRYTDQKEALLLCGLTRLTYLLENDSSVVFKTHAGMSAAYVSPFDLPSTVREGAVEDSTRSFAKTVAVDVDVEIMQFFAMTETQTQGFNVVVVPGAVETVEWLHDMGCAIALQAAMRHDWNNAAVDFLVWRRHVEFVRKVVLPRMQAGAARKWMSDQPIVTQHQSSCAKGAFSARTVDDDIIDLCDVPVVSGVKRSRTVLECSPPLTLRLLSVPAGAEKARYTILLSSLADARLGDVLRGHFKSKREGFSCVGILEDPAAVSSAVGRLLPGFDIAWSRGPPSMSMQAQPLFIKLMSGKEYVALIEACASTVVGRRVDVPDCAYANYMKMVAAWRSQFPIARCILLVCGLPEALSRYDKSRKFRLDSNNLRNFHVHCSVWMEWEVVLLKSDKELVRYLIYMTAAMQKINPHFFPTFLSNCL